MTLKARVLAGECKRQTDAEALERVNSLLSDTEIVQALRIGRSGDPVDGYNSMSIGLTATEERVLCEQMGKVGSQIRVRINEKLPAEGIAATIGGRKLTFSLLGDPTPPRHG